MHCNIACYKGISNKKRQNLSTSCVTLNEESQATNVKLVVPYNPQKTSNASKITNYKRPDITHNERISKKKRENSFIPVRQPWWKKLVPRIPLKNIRSAKKYLITNIIRFGRTKKKDLRLRTSWTTRYKLFNRENPRLSSTGGCGHPSVTQPRQARIPTWIDHCSFSHSNEIFSIEEKQIAEIGDTNRMRTGRDHIDGVRRESRAVGSTQSADDLMVCSAR